MEDKPAVLVVDDQPNWRSLFSDLLEDEYEVVSVGSYEEALEALEKRDPPFRVAVVDIRLDERDEANEAGLSLLEHLRKKGTKSVIVTGYSTGEKARNAFKSGAYDYIEKVRSDGGDFVENFRKVIRDAAERRFVFVAMPFADRYRNIYKRVIKEVVESKGFICKRVDESKYPSRIVEEIKNDIQRAEFVIADLSGKNLNVFYEVGMAHAVGKAVILLTQSLEDVPPKLQMFRCFEYEDSLRGGDNLKKDIAAAIDALQDADSGSQRIFSPISADVDHRLCLALVPFNDSIAQEAFEDIVKNVAEDVGMYCENVQSIYSTTQILDEIWERLNRACIVVSDLSSGDPEVFYLTGMGHGLGKSVILLAQDEVVPFNLRDSSLIVYAVRPFEKGLKSRRRFKQILTQELERTRSSKGRGTHTEFGSRKERSISIGLDNPSIDQKSSNRSPNGHAYTVLGPGRGNRGLSPQDRQRLVQELERYPAWAEGGIGGEKSVLRGANIPDRWIQNQQLTGIPGVDAQNVVAGLEKLGRLQSRSNYFALGALADFLLQHSSDVEGKLFLAYLIDRYSLVTDKVYLKRLRREYDLLVLASDGADWGWRESPDFHWRGPADTSALERIWSPRAPFLDVVFLEQGARCARSVCLIESKEGKALGTGFLIGPGLVLTNYHVVPGGGTGYQVRFGYRRDAEGQILRGQAYPIASRLAFSPVNELDYAVLKVDEALKGEFEAEYLELERDVSVAEGDRVYIIQHPNGEPQKVVLQENQVTHVSPERGRVQYLTNTLGGSSGSPVFNDKWQVVALHHSGKPVPSVSSKFSGNEGILIFAILDQIQRFLS